MKTRNGVSRGRVLALIVTRLALTCGATGAWARQITVDAALGHAKVLANQTQKAYLRVAMTGFEWDSPGQRAPVNLAIVLDKSGSMAGEKIERAKEAALMVLDRLREDDIVSVVAYDSTVTVLVPATRVSDRARIRAAIADLTGSNNTALFAGVSKGAYEVRKFLDRNRVNRIVLLSDGLANVGPSSTPDLAELGASLASDGISITTIGLGLDYNEDLMTALAVKSDGNHIFAERADDLMKAFETEFGSVLSVVARDVRVVVECADGIRPVRVLGRDAEFSGRSVRLSLNDLYGRHTKYLLMEVELPARPAGEMLKVAHVGVSYLNMETKSADRLEYDASVYVVDSPEAVASSENRDVMVSVVREVGAEQNRLAMELRDQGQIEESRRVLEKNVDYLSQSATKYRSRELEIDTEANGSYVVTWTDPKEYSKTRKDMREYQVGVQNQTINR